MNDDLEPREYLHTFLLEQIAAQPMAKAILLFRALASEVDGKDKHLAAECRLRATELERTLSSNRQMSLNLRIRQANTRAAAR